MTGSFVLEQTEAGEIHQAIFTILQKLKSVQGYATIRPTPIRQLQPTDLPALTVVLGEENATADEDATAGPPHFVHNVNYHISVVRGFDDPLLLTDKVDSDMNVIQNLLLRDVGLNRMVEGVTGYRRTRAYPQVSETYVAELRLELTVQFRSTWNPIIPDAFTGANVWSRPRNGPRVCSHCGALNHGQGQTCEACNSLAFPDGGDFVNLKIDVKAC